MSQSSRMTNIWGTGNVTHVLAENKQWGGAWGGGVRQAALPEIGT